MMDCCVHFAATCPEPSRPSTGWQEQVLASEYVHDRSTYYASRALISLIAGDLDAAYDEAAAAVAADPSGINSPKALATQARAALWSNDPDRAKVALSGMRGFRGRWMATVRATTEAGLAALEGRLEEALATYERALRSWSELGIPLDLRSVNSTWPCCLPPPQQQPTRRKALGEYLRRWAHRYCSDNSTPSTTPRCPSAATEVSSPLPKSQYLKTVAITHFGNVEAESIQPIARKASTPLYVGTNSIPSPAAGVAK